MRQIFSVRFFAAVGAVAALLFLLTSVFATRAVIDDVTDGATDAPVVVRRIDLVDRVEDTSRRSVILDDDGFTTVDVTLTIDATRAMTIVPGTPGEVHCDQLASPGGCAVVADLLGEAVVWFALVPMIAGAPTVQLPAIDVLDDGLATLVNGWQVRYTPVLDRRCELVGGEPEFDSYRELRDELGDDFTTLFDLAEQRLTAVVCRVRVPYVEPSAVTDSSETESSETDSSGSGPDPPGSSGE